MPETAGLSLKGDPRREAGMVGLLFASTTSMIGSPEETSTIMARMETQ